MRIKLASERKFDARLSGQHRYCFGSDAPDPDPKLGQSAEAMANVAREQLRFGQRVYDEGKPRQAEIDRISNALAQQQMRLADTNEDRAAQSWDRWNKTFVPVESEFVREAAEAGGEADQQLAAGRAAADVTAASSAAREARNRDLTSMGVNPNSKRFLSVMRAGDTLDAATLAGAKTNARLAAKTQGIGLRQSAANLGRGLPNVSAMADGLSINAGNSAGANAQIGNNTYLQRNAQMSGAYGAAQNGLSNVYDAYSSQYQTQVAGNNAKNQTNGQIAGSVVTAAAMYY